MIRGSTDNGRMGPLSVSVAGGIAKLFIGDTVLIVLILDYTH